jgi:hypothetical protein
MTKHNPTHKPSVHRPHPHEVRLPTAWIVLAFITLVAILASITIVLSIVRPINNVKPYAKTPYVGESLVTNLYSISVKSAKIVTGKDPGFPVADDMQVLVVDFVVENKAAVPLDFAPSQMTFLRDEAADQYEMTPSMLIKYPMAGGAIAGGASRGGELSYWIPKNLESAKKLKFYFDPRWGDMQPVAFDLGIK